MGCLTVSCLIFISSITCATNHFYSIPPFKNRVVSAFWFGFWLISSHCYFSYPITVWAAWRGGTLPTALATLRSEGRLTPLPSRLKIFRLRGGKSLSHAHRLFGSIPEPELCGMVPQQSQTLLYLYDSKEMFWQKPIWASRCWGPYVPSNFLPKCCLRYKEYNFIIQNNMGTLIQECISSCKIKEQKWVANIIKMIKSSDWD